MRIPLRATAVLVALLTLSLTGCTAGAPPSTENVNLIWDRVVTLNGDHPSSSQMCDDVVSDGLLSCGPVGVDRGQ